MAVPIFAQNVIAFLWDFDATLINGYMQQPLFDHYGVDADTFWREVNALSDAYRDGGLRVAQDTAYLGHMLTYVENGTFSDLTNDLLFELGGLLADDLCPGIPDFFQRTKDVVSAQDDFSRHEITVEHYVISTGLLQMIAGSPVGEQVDEIWANEFIANPLPADHLDTQYDHDFSGPISRIGYTIGDTTKTRAVFEINKGVNKLSNVDVNSVMSPGERRVPIPNMIYVADGPSDVPVFSLLNQYDGHTFAVYTKQTEEAAMRAKFEKVKQLQDQGRVRSIGPADFTEGTQTEMWLMTTLRSIAKRICDIRDAYFEEGTPSHVS